jgi:hypothetical protein
MTFRERFDDYCARTAMYLRGREADGLRGQPEKLHELDLATDVDLLKKFCWRIAIIAALGFFFAGPLVLGVLRNLFPEIVMHVLWALIKLGMGLTCAMFALAAYFTFGPHSESG